MIGHLAMRYKAYHANNGSAAARLPPSKQSHIAVTQSDIAVRHAMPMHRAHTQLISVGDSTEQYAAANMTQRQRFSHAQLRDGRAIFRIIIRS